MSCQCKNRFYVINFTAPNGFNIERTEEAAKSVAEKLTRETGQVHMVLLLIGEWSPCCDIQWKTY